MGEQWYFSVVFISTRVKNANALKMASDAIIGAEKE